MAIVGALAVSPALSHAHHLASVVRAYDSPLAVYSVINRHPVSLDGTDFAILAECRAPAVLQGNGLASRRLMPVGSASPTFGRIRGATIVGVVRARAVIGVRSATIVGIVRASAFVGVCSAAVVGVVRTSAFVGVCSPAVVGVVRTRAVIGIRTRAVIGVVCARLPSSVSARSARSAIIRIRWPTMLGLDPQAPDWEHYRRAAERYCVSARALRWGCPWRARSRPVRSGGVRCGSRCALLVLLSRSRCGQGEKNQQYGPFRQDVL